MILILPNISSILIDVWIIGYLKNWFDDLRHWILSCWFVDFRHWILSRWFKCSGFHKVRCKYLCWPVQVH